jgi:hypothetical protein
MPQHSIYILEDFRQVILICGIPSSIKVSDDFLCNTGSVIMFLKAQITTAVPLVATISMDPLAPMVS